jgi:hypothetical protein
MHQTNCRPGTEQSSRVTLIFWIIKIATTTLGETGGDRFTMTLNWGYFCRHIAVSWAACGVLAETRSEGWFWYPTLSGCDHFRSRCESREAGCQCAGGCNDLLSVYRRLLLTIERTSTTLPLKRRHIFGARCLV